jgi:hypothetical protein
MNVSWHLIILPEGKNGMGWAGGELGYHPQLLFFFGFKITTTPIPLNSSFHISIFQEDFYSPTFLTGPLTHLLTDIGPAKTWRQSPKTSITRLLNLLLIIGGTSLLNIYLFI